MTDQELLANLGKRVKVTYKNGLVITGHLVRGETDFNEDDVMLKPDEECIPVLTKIGYDPSNLFAVTDIYESGERPDVVVIGTYR